jgi:hypothetical protein
LKPSDPDAAKLLRWYPRAWRERYGEEFLAMVEDTLDGRRPGWRLRLSVAWAGLRERGRRRFFGQTAAARRRAGYKALFGGWWAYFLAGYLFAALPYDLRASPPPARAWQVSAMLDAVAATAVLIGVAVLIGALAALPAFGRFLRAGGWPKIWRRVAWAAGVTAIAGGGMAALVLLAGSRTYHQLTDSLVFALSLVVTGLLLTVAFGLWARAAKATVRHLDLALRVRVGEMMLAVVTATAVSVMLAFNVILSSAIDSSVPLLLLGVAGLAAPGAAAPLKMKQVVRRGRRLRAAAGRGR